MRAFAHRGALVAVAAPWSASGHGPVSARALTALPGGLGRADRPRLRLWLLRELAFLLFVRFHLDLVSRGQRPLFNLTGRGHGLLILLH